VLHTAHRKLCPPWILRCSVLISLGVAPSLQQESNRQFPGNCTAAPPHFGGASPTGDAPNARPVRYARRGN